MIRFFPASVRPGLRFLPVLLLLLASTQALALAPQSIDFPVLGKRTVGDAAFPAEAWASSGLPITYKSSNPWVATVDASTGQIQVLRAGVTVITASQAGDADFDPAASARQPLWVMNPGSQVLAWGHNNYGQTIVPTGLSDAVSIAGGGYHSVALKSDGTVVAWGGAWAGQSSVPPGLRDVVSIAAGRHHTFALKSNGEVVAWGDSTFGQLNVPSDLGDVVMIATGEAHSVALRSDGTLVAWGKNDFGQSNVPSDLGDVVSIAAGKDFTVALKSDGTVVAWGENWSGQTTIPFGLSDVVAIAAGDGHSVALKRDGTVVAWGNDSHRQANVPAGLTDVVSISAGGHFTTALKSDGTLVAWGNDQHGQSTVSPGLSDVMAVAAGWLHTIALAVPRPPVVTAITPSAGPVSGGTAVTIRGKAFFEPVTVMFGAVPATDVLVDPWGTGLTAKAPAGMLGTIDVKVTSLLGSSDTSAAARFTYREPNSISFPPLGQRTMGESPFFAAASASSGLPVAYSSSNPRVATVDATTGLIQVLNPGLTMITASQAGDADFDSAASVRQPLWVKNPALGVIAWGDASYAQTTVPADLNDAVMVVAGFSHSVALRRDGTVVAWGKNDSGQATVPPGLSDVVSLGAGYGHSIALKSDGTVVAWGSNEFGQATVPGGLSDVVAIAAAHSHNAALKSDGTVVVWGANGSGQRNVPADLSDVVSISAGIGQTVALKGDGTVVAWGTDWNGLPASVPTGLSDVVSISAGGWHTVALKSDGTVVAWGQNNNDQTDVPPDLRDVVSIAAGWYHTLALTKFGNLVTWGADWSGLGEIPRGSTRATSIAGGYSHSLALVPVPAITDISPAEGPLSGGTTVTITGLGFTTGTSVFFGGTAAVGVTVDETGTSLTAESPAGSAGTVDVTVTTPDGTSEALLFTYTKFGQVIDFSVSDQTYGSAPVLAASAGSTLPVTFSSRTPAVCSVSVDGTLTLLRADTCAIAADQAGNAFYAAAETVVRSFAVRPKSLAIAGVVAKSKVYDGTTDAVVDTTAGIRSLVGLVGRDEVSLVLGSARFATKDADRGLAVTVTGSRLSGPDAGNYTLAEVAGLTADIAEKPLSILADSASKVFGESDPALTYATSGLVGGDALTGTLARAPGERADSYAIGEGSLSAGPNYEISFTGAQFTITPKRVVVIADSLSKKHGDTDPVLTYRVTGLVLGDSLTGALARAPGEVAGSYAITQGSLAAGSNYTLSFTGSFLTILPGPVALSPRSVRGAPPGALSATLFQDFALSASGAGRGELGTNGAGCDANACQSVDLALPRPARVRVAIYDRLGTPVISWSERFDARALRRSEGRVRLWWNLRAQNGAAVAPGVYLWKIEAESEKGQELEKVLRTGVR